MFKITEHIPYRRVEFSFQGFKDLANQLRMFRDLYKLRSDKKYRVLIEEL